jgi:prolipoprotein diacylglyceryl transferase
VVVSVAALPAPPGNAIHLWRLQIRAYGAVIALGVIVAVAFAQRRWVARGGRREDITALALWAVPAGLLGARAYHVITDPELFRGRWLHVFAIWEGGLGIPGGIAAGVLVGAWVAHRRRLPLPPLLDTAAPAIPLAQAIGRWGNWFNQELFGGPTTLPWALRVDPAHRPAAYAHVSTFHPTFLYEALWDLALVALLLVIERHVRLRPGRLFVVYVAGYSLGRLWIERLRIDHANRVFGLRVNEWVSLVALTASLAVLLIDHYRPGAVDTAVGGGDVSSGSRDPGTTG